MATPRPARGRRRLGRSPRRIARLHARRRRRRRGGGDAGRVEHLGARDGGGTDHGAGDGAATATRADHHPSPAWRRTLTASFARLQPRLHARSVGVALVVVGRTDPLTLGTWRSGPAWSTIKVPLSIAASQHVDSASTRQLIHRAITRSDNAAAEALWARLGSGRRAASEVDAVLRADGDGRTRTQWRQVRPPFTPFGQTTWSLADQLAFTRHLACDRHAASVRTQMSAVVAAAAVGARPAVARQDQGRMGTGPARPLPRPPARARTARARPRRGRRRRPTLERHLRPGHPRARRGGGLAPGVAAVAAVGGAHLLTGACAEAWPGTRSRATPRRIIVAAPLQRPRASRAPLPSRSVTARPPSLNAGEPASGGNDTLLLSDIPAIGDT